MNCASARCRRATAPDISTKREPESFAAVSKSMPGAMPVSSKCSFGVEVELPRGAPAVKLHVVVLVRAVGDVVIGQVRDAGEQVAERGVLVLGFLLQRGDLVLLGGHQRAEAFEFRLVALCLGAAHLLGGRVALGQRGLGGLDAGAAGLVERSGSPTTGGRGPCGRGLRRRLPGPREWRGCRAWRLSSAGRLRGRLWRSLRGGGRGGVETVGTGEARPGDHVGDQRAERLAEDGGDGDAFDAPVAGPPGQERRAGKARDDGQSETRSCGRALSTWQIGWPRSWSSSPLT
jgi:hypothetical protein